MPTILRGRYRLDTKIGGGGMGEVWSAHDDVLDRTVAVKIISPHLAGDDTIRERLRLEAQLAGSLHHPGIVDIYDYGEHETEGQTVPFLVMPLVEGASLSDVLKARAPLPVGETMAIVAEMATALQAAHDAGIIHRDLKPANVLLTPAGRVMLADFGIARSVGGNPLTQTGALIGTADYLSPEQSTGKQATFASDLYALGIVAYTCLTGTPPFRRDADIATALAHLQDPVPDLPQDVQASGVQPLIERLLAKDPAGRPESAGAVAAAAAAFATSVPVIQEANGAADKNPADASSVATGLLAATQPGSAATEPGTPPTHPGTAAMPLVAAAPAATATFDAVTPETAVPGHAEEPRRPRRVVMLSSAVVAIAVMAFALMSAFGGDKVTVPDVRGSTSVEAAAEMARAGLDLTTKDVDAEGYDAGEVVDQSPEPGDKVAKGSTVEVTVATGAVAIPTDKLIGKSYADAAKILEKLGLKPARVDKASTKTAGSVIAVDPSKRAKAGDTVVLTVASAPIVTDDKGKKDSKDQKKKDDKKSDDKRADNKQADNKGNDKAKATEPAATEPVASPSPSPAA